MTGVNARPRHGQISIPLRRQNQARPRATIAASPPYRLAEKKSKRDLEWSDANVRDLERYQMNTDRPSVADALISEHPHLRLDNTDRTAEDVATEILAWLDTLA